MTETELDNHGDATLNASGAAQPVPEHVNPMTFFNAQINALLFWPRMFGYVK